MQKAKAWLHSQGHIATAGRGRPPTKSQKDGRDISAILLEASKSGVQFSDWPKGKVEVTKTEANGDTPAETTVKVIRTERSSGEKVISEIHYTYPESDFEAYEFVNGKRKRVGMREVCNTCRVSLVAHWCASPTVWGDHKVFIERKKG